MPNDNQPDDNQPLRPNADEAHRVHKTNEQLVERVREQARQLQEKSRQLHEQIEKAHRDIEHVHQEVDRVHQDVRREHAAQREVTGYINDDLEKLENGAGASEEE